MQRKMNIYKQVYIMKILRKYFNISKEIKQKRTIIKRANINRIKKNKRIYRTSRFRMVISKGNSLKN